MTLDMLMTALGHHGLVGFDSLNTPFDPHHHQALNQVDDPSVASNTIVKVAQRGYKLHDRLLRPALVTVAIGGMPNQTKDDEKPSKAKDNQPEVLADDGTTATPHTAEQSNEDDLELDIDVDVASTDQPASASLNEGAPLPDGDEEYDLGDVQDALDMFLAGEEIE